MWGFDLICQPGGGERGVMRLEWQAEEHIQTKAPETVKGLGIAC